MIEENFNNSVLTIVIVIFLAVFLHIIIGVFRAVVSKPSSAPFPSRLTIPSPGLHNPNHPLTLFPKRQLVVTTATDDSIRRRFNLNFAMMNSKRRECMIEYWMNVRSCDRISAMNYSVEELQKDRDRCN